MPYRHDYLKLPNARSTFHLMNFSAGILRSVQLILAMFGRGYGRLETPITLCDGLWFRIYKVSAIWLGLEGFFVEWNQICPSDWFYILENWVSQGKSTPRATLDFQHGLQLQRTTSVTSHIS